MTPPLISAYTVARKFVGLRETTGASTRPASSPCCSSSIAPRNDG
jgi:hypothetical protein